MKIAIVGAGIIGASCAYHLSKLGLDVIVLERNPNPAMGSTAKSAAGIRHQFSHKENIKMSQYSASEYENFEELTSVNANFKKNGYLFLIAKEQEKDWQKQIKLQKSLGVNVEFLSQQATKEKFDYINTNALLGSSLSYDDGTLDPNAISFGYIKAAKKMGCQVFLEQEVRELNYINRQWQIKTNSNKYFADAIINAAGPHAASIAKLAGFEIPVLPYRRNVYMTGPVENFKHPSPLIIDMTSGVYLRSEAERIIFGLSNHNEKAGFNEQVDWDWLEHTLSLALPRFPFLESTGLDYKSCWAGLYSITPDHFPILGKMPNSSFYNAVGFSGHGVQHAAAVGRILAEEISTGKVSSFNIDDFRFERFSKKTQAFESNIV